MKFLRRIVKFAMIIVLLSVGLYLYSKYIEPNMLVTMKYNIDVPEEVSESRIVFFSDTHFGKLYSQNNIEKIVDKINSQNPDIVVFGGDFFDNYARDISLIDLKYLQEKLNLIDAKYGKYAIFGNHDYGGGAIRIYEEFMEESGFDIIKSSNEFIKELNINLIGFDDYLIGQTDTRLYSLPKDTYNIILSHEPDVANEVMSPINSTMISGHSHGGQVELPFITNKVLPIGAKDYIKGKYENVSTNKNIDLLVSRGIGMTKYPYRLLNMPEILVVDLKN